MKISMFKMAATSALLLLSSVVNIANAGLITRAEFGPSATEYDFTGTSTGQVIVGDGNLSLSNGRVEILGSLGFISGNSYYDGADSSVIRLDFASAVSAVGLDFIVNNQPTTLSLFNSSNLLIETTTLSNIGLPLGGSYPYGFIGLNVGSAIISYATIDTPLIGNELYIDNIIYQSSSIPEPSTLAILALGIMGLASRRFKR